MPISTGACATANWRWPSTFPPISAAICERGHWPEIGVWVDGAMPFRGETMSGYMQGMHLQYVQQIIREATGVETA